MLPGPGPAERRDVRRPRVVSCGWQCACVSVAFVQYERFKWSTAGAGCRSESSADSGLRDDTQPAQDSHAQSTQDVEGTSVLPPMESAAAASEADVDAGESLGGLDVEEGRVLAVLELLLSRGELEEIPGEGEGEKSDVRYRLVPPVPDVRVIEKEKRKRGRPEGVRDGEQEARMHGELVDFGVLPSAEVDQQLQSSLEALFADFFEGVVSEWNPFFTEEAVQVGR